MASLLPKRVKSGKGALECDWHAECPRDECASAHVRCIQLHQPAGEGPVKGVQGLGCGWGWRAGRMAVSTLGAPMNVCAWL